MAFRINTNVSALVSQGHLNQTQGAIGKSVERLSSGLRINRGADDAAGLTISEKIRGQIRGLNRAVLNAQDGISLIQTAEGALNEDAAILNRMRELAIQSSNDTLTTNDRLEIQKEIDQLIDEVDRIALTTEFNTKKLLDGTASSIVTTNSQGIQGIQVGSAKESAGDYSVELYLSAKGVRQESASNILTVRDEDKLVSRDTKLGHIESFYDNEGNNVLRNPTTLTIRGNEATTSMTLSSDMRIEEFTQKLKDLIIKDKKDGGLGVKGTDVSFSPKTGQILIRSGRDGSSGDISFSTDEDIIKAFGFQVTVVSEDPAYRAQAVQQGVASPIVANSSTTTNRFMNIIPGIDLQFQPPTSAMLEGIKPPVDVIRIGDDDVTFSIADTNADMTEGKPTHYVNVTLKANTSYSLTSIESIINFNIRTGINQVTGESFFDNVNYSSYTAPDIRASFQGSNLVLKAGNGGTSSVISIFGVSSGATNVLGLQNGVFSGDRGESSRLIGSKDVSSGVNIGNTPLTINIKGPDGKNTGTNIIFQAGSNVSTTSLVSTVNQGLRTANIKAEATIDANGFLVIESIETGDDTAMVLSSLSGSLTDIGFVNGAAASGSGGDFAMIIGKTNTSFIDYGFTFDNSICISLIDQFGASSGPIRLGMETTPPGIGYGEMIDPFPNFGSGNNFIKVSLPAIPTSGTPDCHLQFQGSYLSTSTGLMAVGNTDILLDLSTAGSIVDHLVFVSLVDSNGDFGGNMWLTTTITGMTSGVTKVSLTSASGAPIGVKAMNYSFAGDYPTTTNNNVTLSSNSITTLLRASDLTTTDIGFEFDNGGKLRFFSKSIGNDSRILLQSTTPEFNPFLNIGLDANTSATTFMSTFGMNGNSAVQGNGETKFMLHVTDRSISLQIGANEGQMMDSSVGSFTANSLGLIGLDVTSINSAKKALGAIDIAVNLVSSERSKLGSVQNRLGSTINNLTVTSTNLQAAESRIRDVDVADETVQFTRNQILIQAGTSQLAQAKALPQQALQLLGG